MVVTFAQRLAFMGSLALLAGYTDTICYKRNQAMAVSMTGNFIVGGRAFADMHDGEEKVMMFIYYASLILSYSLGGVAYRIAENKRTGRGATLLAPLVVLLIIVQEVLEFTLVGEHRVRWLMCFLTPCFGAANVMSLTGFVAADATTPTRHLLSVNNALGRMTAGVSEEDRVTLWRSGTVILSFVGGILLGDFASDPLQNYHWLFLPVGPLLAVLFVVHDRLTAMLQIPLPDLEKAEALEDHCPVVDQNVGADALSAMQQQLIVVLPDAASRKSS
jgi:uncharacterized membrane protein YoaK (UPF0700 family)